jgi:copper chaperone CopZ
MRAVATQISVLHAKEHIEKNGNIATVAAVRKFLGGGSYSTINRHLKYLRGVMRVSSSVAKSLLEDNRAQKIIIEKLRDDNEIFIIDVDDKILDCNITVQRISTSRQGDVEVSEDGISKTGSEFLPRGGYVLYADTHSVACHCPACVQERRHE